MKKLPIAIIILLVITSFAVMDYAVNIHRLKSVPVPMGQPESDPYPNLTQSLIEKNPILFPYKITKRNRTSQLFEKFDLTNLNARVYRNTLVMQGKATDEQGTGVAVPNEKTLTIYEIQGPANQGGVTYLDAKTKMTNQIDAVSSINEVSQFGSNSLYYNDLNHPDTVYLFAQVGDNIFGFEYLKKDEDTFKTIKAMIDALMEMK